MCKLRGCLHMHCTCRVNWCDYNNYYIHCFSLSLSLSLSVSDHYFSHAGWSSSSSSSPFLTWLNRAQNVSILCTYQQDSQDCSHVSLTTKLRSTSPVPLSNHWKVLRSTSPVPLSNHWKVLRSSKLHLSAPFEMPFPMISFFAKIEFSSFIL